MNRFSANELAAMQATQEAAMQDQCVRLVYADGGAGSYGTPSPGWTAAEVLVCGFDPSAAREVMAAGQVVVTDAVARLPIAAELDSRDRLRITHRFGVALAAPLTFEMIGIPERGPSGLRVNLRLVSDGSDA